MAAQLGWQQKWSASGLSWSAAWADAQELGDVTLGAVGHATLATGGLNILIRKDLGDLTIGAVGHSGISGNVTSLLPTALNLGSLAINARGLTTVATGGFNTVDPYWIDPPFTITAVGHATITATLGLTLNTTKLLGAVTLAATGRSTLSQPTVNYGVLKQLGALTLNAIGGSSMTAVLNILDQPPTDLAPQAFATRGLATITADNLYFVLPPKELGDLTLAATGRATVAAATIFSGGPFALPGVQPIVARGRATISASFSYPPFDNEKRIDAVITEAAPTVFARVEEDEINFQ